MFTRHGYHRTTLRLLADRLGVTKAAILYHFPAKDRIIQALMEPFVVAIEDAIERAAALPFPASRLALLEGLLDTYLAHQRLLRWPEPTRRSSPTRRRTSGSCACRPGSSRSSSGPDAPLEDKVWAVQLLGTLGDSVLFFAEAPTADLRAAVLAGPAACSRRARRTARRAAPATGTRRSRQQRHRPRHTHPRRSRTPRAATAGRTAPAGGVGRPRALSGARVDRARELHRAGSHTVDEIAATLGVSRATVYRYVSQTSLKTSETGPGQPPTPRYPLRLVDLALVVPGIALVCPCLGGTTTARS